MRSTVGRWLAAIAMVTGLLVASSPASIAQAAVGDSGHICLTNASSYCIKTNGTGNQVTITNVAADKANFTLVYDSGGDHQFRDGNGNCLREGTGGVVKIVNGPCMYVDPNESWSHSGTTWHNYNDNAIMYTKGHVTGDDVWTAGTPPSGAWSKWNAPT